jgi:hypothetical protein
MFKNVFILVLLFIFAGSVWPEMDASVILRETLLDDFLTAVGPISKTEKFSLVGVSGEYTWTVKNPKIEISTDKARFQADASINVKGFKYDTTAVGEVEVKYNETNNKISVKILKAAIQIYIKVFGKQVNITEVDISKFYKMQFEFAGPKPLQTSVDITMPDGSKKTIMVTAQAKMALEPHQIVVGSELTFIGKK